MRRPRDVASLSLVLGLSLFAACNLRNDFVPIGSAKGELKPQSPIAAVDVQLRIGSITLREVDGDTVRVAADVSVRKGNGAAASTPAALPFADWVALRESNGTVEIRPTRGDDDHMLQLVIEVPRGKRAIVAKLAAGKVEVAVAEATTMTLGTEAGEVVCAADVVAETLRADVAAGNFDGVVKRRCGGASISVRAGRVGLGLPPDCEGTFDLAADVGDVAGVDRLGLTTNRSLASAKAVGKRGTGTATFTIRVGAGQIAIR